MFQKSVQKILKHYDVIREDRDVRYDVDSKQLKLRNGEFIVDKSHGIENTKGNRRQKERNHDFAFELSGLYNWFSQRRESQYVRQSDHTNYRRSNGQSKPNQVLTPFIKTTN
ncbi:Bardet-Biedl syndrome 5 -like protein [Trichinella britovi]|uniref:Bardet-Biedl syndrome 5-like protein n=1 Tax=Trichinella britovi TaxID=45882 RepID=A0A0V1C3U9_TRIBR|nr:Bardet-Biedl syndrome 5 -like protein [Trichinella britovi]